MIVLLILLRIPFHSTGLSLSLSPCLYQILDPVWEKNQVKNLSIFAEKAGKQGAPLSFVRPCIMHCTSHWVCLPSRKYQPFSAFCGRCAIRTGCIIWWGSRIQSLKSPEKTAQDGQCQAKVLGISDHQSFLSLSLKTTPGWSIPAGGSRKQWPGRGCSGTTAWQRFILELGRFGQLDSD